MRNPFTKKRIILVGVPLALIGVVLVLMSLFLQFPFSLTGFFLFDDGVGTGSVPEVPPAVLEENPSSENSSLGTDLPSTNGGLGNGTAINSSSSHGRGGGSGSGSGSRTSPNTGPPPFTFPGIFIRDARGRPFTYSSFWTRKGTGLYDLDLQGNGQKVTRLTFRNVRLSNGQDFDLRLDESDALKQKSRYQWKKMFAIDPSSINFTDGEIVSVAQGETLYKCKDWNFTQQRCTGRWTKLMDIVPGQEYTIPIDPLDPGFAELGVASINTNKSRYRPGEPSKITAVVLNTSGFLVPNASVLIEVIDPNNTIHSFSTGNGTVVENNTGIYEVVYSDTSLEGVYGMYVAAQATGVNNSMYSEFTVESNYTFEILRNTPVTIDPFIGPFATSFTLYSLTNDSGPFNFTERLPFNFTVNNSFGGSVSYLNDSVEIVWSNLSNGSSVSYLANAPLVTPDLHALGPSSVNSSTGGLFEARQWWLAIDPIVTVINTSRQNATDPGNHSAIAGNVTEITFEGDSVTQSWQGYFGNVSGTITLEDATGNALYNWSSNNPTGEVYASRSGSVSFSSMTCANDTEISAEETALGQVTSDVDSVSNTFTKNLHPQFYVASTNISVNSCNSTNIYNLNGPQNTEFFEVLLSDTTDIVYTALLEDDVIGFDNRTHDFEMLVGEDGHGTDTNTTLYYFYIELY